MRKLWFPLLGLLASTAVLAQQSTTALITEINTNLPNNTTGAITPAILRTTLIDIVNSYLNTTNLCTIGVSGAFPIYNATTATWTCSTTGGTGSVAKISGSFHASATDATLLCPASAFYSPSSDAKIKSTICGESIWDSSNGGLNGAAMVLNNVVRTGAGIVGAPGAMFAGTEVTANIVGLDAHGATFYINNSSPVSLPVGTAIYALVRGDVGTSASAFVGPTGIQVLSEVSANQHPRVGAYIGSSLSTNAFDRGLWVANGVTYGILVGSDPGSPNITDPAIPIAVIRTPASPNTNLDGVVLSNFVAAASGLQQHSPRLRLTGSGWKTDATAHSEVVDWTIQNVPTQGTANAGTELIVANQLQDGGGYFAAARFAATGSSGGNLALGTAAMNAGGTGGDLQVARASTTGAVYFGSSGNSFLYQDGAKFQLAMNATPILTASPTELTLITAMLRATYGTPTIASGACGTGSNGVVTSGTNQSGLVTIGATATTTCTVTFSTVLSNAPNACVIFPHDAGAAATGTTVARVSSVSATNWVITGGALASTSYYYFCM